MVVDDTSTDLTAKKVQLFKNEFSKNVRGEQGRAKIAMYLEVNNSIRGHGSAIVRALQIAYSLQNPYVLTIGCDGQFVPSDVRKVLEHLIRSGRRLLKVRVNLSEVRTIVTQQVNLCESAPYMRALLT